jgi:hypothetical protein
VVVAKATGDGDTEWVRSAATEITWKQYVVEGLTVTDRGLALAGSGWL